jgi:hypothetical protein
LNETDRSIRRGAVKPGWIASSNRRFWKLSASRKVAPIRRLAMFVVSEAEATAIRAAFDRGGELSAAVELRRLFPLITDTMQARECARTIAGWKPLAPRPPGLEP